MTAYLAVMSARFMTLLQYRAAAVAGFGTQLFWGLIRVMIFAAFFRSTTSPQPMNEADVLSYVWLGQAMFALLMLSVDGDIAAMIRSGTVVYELLRPVDLYWAWFARSVALRSAPTLMRGAPILIVAGILFGLKTPPSVASALAFAGAILGTLMLAASITTLMSVSLMWTISGLGVTRVVPAFAYALSGIVIPLPFFPERMQPLVNFLPFRHLVDTPFRLYLGHIPPEQAFGIIAQEAAWTTAMVLLGRWLLSRGTRQLVAQGG